MPRAFKNKRSVSCPVRGTVLSPSGITFENEAFRRRNEARLALLIEAATSPTSSSNNALLAQKTLKSDNLTSSPQIGDKMRCSLLDHVKEWLEQLHDLTTEHQYLGRYSIEKLCAFNEYQQKTSVYRVIAVILFTPAPTILTLWLLDCMPLRDPRGGAKHHATTFLRSMFSHMVMTYMFLMAGKQALRLNTKNSQYTHKKAALISICVAVCLEAYCVLWAFAWRFPTPFREFTGVTPWGMLTVLFNYIFAKQDISRVLGRLKRYIPVVGTQLILFYFLLLLSVGFAAVPLQIQIGMILIFPLIKLTIKRALWKYARNLYDISADVTICMVEISGSLYQTVCMQYVQNNVLALVIMIMDFLQAAFEARSYMSQDYIGDSKTTLQTAVKIVESALFTGMVERKIELSPEEGRNGEGTSARSWYSTSAAPSPPQTANQAMDGPPKVRPVINKPKAVSARKDMAFEVEPAYESFADVVARLLRKGKAWSRRRRRRASRREQRYSADDDKSGQLSARKKIKRRGSSTAQIIPRSKKVARRNNEERPQAGRVNISRETATSVYINARVIRKGKARRLLDFGQVYAVQQNLTDDGVGSELPMAPAIAYIPHKQRETAGLTHRGSDTNRGSMLDSNDMTDSQTNRGSVAPSNRGSITDMQLVDIADGQNGRPMIRRKNSTNTKLLKRKSSGSLVPGLGALGRRMSITGSTTLSDALTPRTSRVATDDDDQLFGHRGIEKRGVNGIAIDDIVIKRKDQARILEQTLQLLFSAEVLLFVEYMEVFMPILYAACIGGLWHLPNAKYSVVLMNMSYNAMVLEVGTSLLYAMLEVLSFCSMYFFIKKRYGISALYQLAFLLETYAMTLQGKLIGCFITILNSSTLHQGIDITFKFDMDALLKTPDPIATLTEANTNPSQPKSVKKHCCGLRKLGLILIAEGALLAVIAIVYGSALPPLINNKVKDGVVVCDASGAEEESYYDAYGDCDDCNPYYYTLHMFNASNAEAYLAGETSKLQLQEVGPYVFRRREFKIDINFLDDGARVSYKSYTYHTFEKSLSCDGCSDSDKFTSFDVGYLNVIAQAGGEEAFLMKLGAGSFSTNETVIADAIANYGPQMMRWVNGLNSLDPIAMNNVASGGTVLTFLATGPEAIADLDLSGFAYNGIFVTRTASQWALGYPSLLAGLGLGSEYVTSCNVTGGWNEKCASCKGDACLEIWYECKQCALGASVVAINNVTCGIIENIYAEEYGAEEAATFRENTCGLCEAFGLCAAPLPGIAEDSGLDYSKTPPAAADLEAYIQLTGCADDTEILNYEEFNGYTSTALWVSTLGEERRNPTLSEIIAFNDYGNCANPTANLTCSAVQGNDATSIKPGGAGMTGFENALTQETSDMYLDEGKQNVTLYSTGEEIDHEGITLHRFSPPNNLLVNSEFNNAKGTGWPVDGVQPLAFSAGFLAFVSYPVFIYGNTSLLDAVEITMSDGIVASKDSMYDSGPGDLKQEYIEKYVTYIDVEAGTGKTMVAHKRLMASYALSYSALNESAPMSDVLWPNLEAEVIFPAYWGEESATIGSSSVDYYHLIQHLLKSVLPVLIVGLIVGVVLRKLRAQTACAKNTHSHKHCPPAPRLHHAAVPPPLRYEATPQEDTVKSRVIAWLHYLRDLKTEHQYLGRYSVEKLCAFHAYQERTSIYRVIAVIVLTPLPTVLTLWGLDCLPLRDPRGGAKRHATTFLRSILSHAIMTYMFLLAAKQAVGLNVQNSKYTHRKVALISLAVAVCLESWWIIWAFNWRFPIPCREFFGVTPWGILTVLFNYIFAKEELSRVWGRLRRYIPVVGTQMMLFYFLLFLSVGFAAVPWWAQITMTFTFPLVKLSIKRALWKYARNLNDISADVTICMVEISGSLYQTVCMNYVQSSMMALLLMALDFVQAAHEAHVYVRHDYISDSKSTLQTAVRIVESALYSGSVEKLTTDTYFKKPEEENQFTTSNLPPTPPPLESPPRIRPAIKPHPSFRDMVFEPETRKESIAEMMALLLRKGASWRRRRRQCASRRQRRYAVDADESPKKSSRRQKRSKPTSGRSSATSTPRHSSGESSSAKSSPRGVGIGGINTTKEAATSIYINANVIRRGNMRRILDFGQVYANQKGKADASDKEDDNKLPMAPATPFVPSAKMLGEAPDHSSASNLLKGTPHRRSSTTRATRGSLTDTSLVDRSETYSVRPIIRRKSSSTNKKLLKKMSSRSILPTLGATGRRMSGSIMTTDGMTSVVEDSDDERLFGHRGIEIHGNSGVSIDDILIRRKDQARILEQTLQLLFAAEVLLFVEYMEVFMPLLYSACVGGLWNLPNAKYNVMLMQMSYDAMVLEVLTSMGYAMLEVVSFLSVYYFIKKKYSISALYQLAFLLESYTMTLQGKLIGCFITILNSSTLHQGIDITFKFDWDALLKTPDPYKND
ncbi:unnamed protein product [Phytophthora lilii]|uniref:Unnamed protein product n=2 Tax=Phytophthora lilii TaxID=2077276 RepID=A0A9W6XBU2_9STRA|nr:unnamed protein product [Phytophthora lilii]